MKTSKRVSLSLTAFLLCLAVFIGTVPPVSFAAEDDNSSVYSFDYGSGITWPEDEPLPTFSEPAEEMDAVVATNLSADIKVTLASLQGLVNKVQPRLIVMSDTQEGIDTWPTDTGLNYKKVGYRDLLEKYEASYKGFVITDPDLADTRNLATSIAGAEDYLPVNESLYKTLSEKYPEKAKNVIDLRENNFADKYAAYTWLYEQYYKTGKLTTRMLFGLDPTGHMPNSRDLATAMKCAVLWLEPNNEQDEKVLDMFYNMATPGITYHLGWWPNEDSGVVYGTRKGVASIPADCTENLTVYSGQSKQLDIPEVPEKPELENKVYVALTIADGDNTQYNQHYMRHKNNAIWGSEYRKKEIPINFTISPALYYLAPQMLNYYFKTSTENNCLISGPSGIGYSKATRWREVDGFLENFVAHTNDTLEKSGIRVTTIWDRMSEETFEEFSLLNKANIGVTINNNDFNDADINNPDSMFQGWWAGGYKHYPENGKTDYKNGLAIHGLGTGMGYEHATGNIKENLQNVIRTNIAAGSTSPDFRLVQVIPWNDVENGHLKMKWIYDMANELIEEFGSENVEFVRADHFFMLMNEANNQPYNMSHQQQVKASTAINNTTAENAVDGSVSTSWESKNIGSEWIQVDLGTHSDIARVVVKNAEAAGMDASFNTKAFKIQVSENGQIWKDAASVTDNTEAVSYLDLDNVSARYVRLCIDDAGASDGIARIQDFEVYANKAVYQDEDMEALKAEAELVERGEAVSDEHWSAFEAARDELIRVVDEKETESYQQAAENYYAAKENLTAEKTELSEELNKLTQLDENDFTQTGYQNALEAYENAQQIINSSDADADQISAAAAELKKYNTPVVITAPDNEIERGKTLQLTASESVSYSVSNDFVTVSDSGLATGVKSGESTITAVSSDGFRKDEITVSVIVKATAVEITDSFVAPNSTKQLSVKFTPADTTDYIAKWSVDGTSAAEVSQDGVLTAKSGGSVTVTAETNRGVKTSKSIEIRIPVTQLKLSKTSASVNLGDSFMLNCTVIPSNATNNSFVWYSSNQSVATVDANGFVRAVGYGTATIFAESVSDMGVVGKCTVNVVKPTAVKPSTPKNGVKNGVLYKNSKKVTGTKVIKVGLKTYYIKNGKVQKGRKIVKYKNKLYAVNNGIVMTAKKTRVVKVGKKSYIVSRKGIVSHPKKGYKQYKAGKKKYIVNKSGVIQKNKKRIRIGKKIYRTNKKGIVVKVMKR